MGERAVVVASGLQSHTTSPTKATEEVNQALHVCSAVGHAKAVSLT